MKKIFILFFCLLGSSLFAPVQSEVVKKVLDNGLLSWKIQEAGLELELIQRLPDQTRGFFEARGFSNVISNDIALSCIFQTIGKNVSDKATGKPITISLKNWRLRQGQQVQGIKLKETWDSEWSQEQVTKAARIAFRWATFPTEQTFEPTGDYNWGMVSMGVPPKSQFDLLVIWNQDGREHKAWVNSMECAEDR